MVYTCVDKTECLPERGGAKTYWLTSRNQGVKSNARSSQTWLACYVLVWTIAFGGWRREKTWFEFVSMSKMHAATRC